MALRIFGKAKGLLDCKRFYLPGITMSDECKECNETITFDGEHEYVSYPKLGEPSIIVLHCRDCDTEIVHKIQLDLTISPV